MPDQLTALDPTGFPVPVAGTPLAAPLDTLAGKRVMLVDGRFDDSILPFVEEMQRWFAEHRPEVDTEIVRWREAFVDDPDAMRAIGERGDAVIFAVGV